MKLNVENMKSWVCNLLKAILCGFNALVERVAGFIYKNAREIGTVVKVYMLSLWWLILSVMQ